MSRFATGPMLAGAVITLLAPGLVHGQQSRATLSQLKQREARVQAVVKKVADSVVAISDGRDGWGSGVIVSGDGLILTAGHVSMDVSRMQVVFPDGRQMQAKSLGRNLNTDSAMLKLISSTDSNGKPWPAVERGRARELKRGDWAIAMGHPGGQKEHPKAPVRLGRILSIGSRTIVTDATIIVGDSGGPLFDLNGKLIGINSMITSDITTNRHVLIDVIRRDWARLEDGDSWGRLGDFDTNLVSSRMYGTRLTWRGYDPYVFRVRENSPAELAGLKRGDRLVKIDGQAIADPLELSLILGERDPGDEVSTEYARGNRIVKTSVVLGPVPPASRVTKVPVQDGPGEFEKASGATLAEFRPVAARAAESVVQLFDRDDETKQLALGAVVAKDGLIATKYSEVNDVEYLGCRFSSGLFVEATVVAFDRPNDIAILQVNANNLRPLKWQSEPSDVGQLLVTGNPFGKAVAVGVTSLEARALNNPAFLGVSSMIPRGGRRIGRSSGGAAIGEVIEHSAAERAGLRKGDRITMINGRFITDFQDLTRRIKQFKPGTTVSLTVLREINEYSYEEKKLDVELSGRFVMGDWRRQFAASDLLGPPLSDHSNGFPRVLQHDTVFSATDCGGPLLNLSGEAVGLNIARAGRVVSYAIPAVDAQRVIKKLIAEARRGKAA